MGQNDFYGIRINFIKSLFETLIGFNFEVLQKIVLGVRKNILNIFFYPISRILENRVTKGFFRYYKKKVFSQKLRCRKMFEFHLNEKLNMVLIVKHFS